MVCKSFRYLKSRYDTVPYEDVLGDWGFPYIQLIYIGEDSFILATCNSC